jgi:hypothetical protein
MEFYLAMSVPDIKLFDLDSLYLFIIAWPDKQRFNPKGVINVGVIA